MSDEQPYLSVKNWSEFQHYKDRSPPWIKVYNALLSDYDFSCLQDASKAHLIGIWLLASQLENKIPADPIWVQNRINATEPVNLKLLVDKGFLLDASNALATCKQDACPETEERRDRGRGRGRVDRADPDWSTVPNLDTEAWNLWLAHRRSLKIKPYSSTQMAARLAKFPQTVQRAAIEESITQNWQGLFPEKVKTNGAHQQGNGRLTFEQHQERLREWAREHGVDPSDCGL